MTTPRSSRVPELDLLRFLAAMAVVFYHQIWTHPEFPEWATNSAQLGYLGVHVFFMISGFVILWTAVDRAAWEFVASRVSRLYPSFWAGLAITSFLFWIARDGVTFPRLAANATMLPTVFKQEDIDPVYWTLTTEWKFYGVVIALILFRQMQRVELWFSVWLAASSLALLMPENYITKQLTLSGYSSYFITGAALFFIRMRGATATRVWLFAVSALLGAWKAGTAEGSEVWVPVASAAVVAFMSVVFLGIAWRVLTLPASRTWYWLGALTYPLYLLHYRAGNVLKENLPRDWTEPERVAVVIVAALLASVALALTVERHATRALHQWLLALPGRWRAAPAAPYARPD